MRKTGIDILGDVPWGSHICHFYQTKEDLIEILVPYFKAGLENNEFCMWLTSGPLKAHEAKKELGKVVDKLDRYIEKGQIEILDSSREYLKYGEFDANRLIQGWIRKEEDALEKGYYGLRLSGNTFWLERKEWESFLDYENLVESLVKNYRMLAICSYSLNKCRASDMIDVANNHQFSLIRREGKWEILEGYEKKEVQKAIERNELLNFILFQHFPIETVVVDFKGRVVRFNLAEKISEDGLPRRGDVMFKDFANNFEIDMYTELMECLRLNEKKEFPELKFGKKFLSVMIAPFPKGAIITIQDISEQKLLEKEKEKLQIQLMQSEKMAGICILASGVAHEFNNLLQIMSGHSEFALRTEDRGDMKEALNVVINTSDRARRIVENLPAFSRAETPEKESCNITELLETVLSLTEGQLNKHNIKVVRRFGKTPKIEINKVEIHQVFLNMVTNARDSMLPKGGKLEININQEKENIEISFKDTGGGIREEDLERVFEPFYTTKGAVGGNTAVAGAGLGVAVSYGIVKRHGGTIDVKSQMGKGTTFTIKLPITKKDSLKKIIKE